MKVENHTIYNTRDLRKLFLAGLKHEGMDPKNYKIVVKYRKGRTYGYAYYNRKWIQINLPKECYQLSIKQVARTLVHEICHNRGLRHREMDYKTIDTSWAEGYSIRFEKPKEKKRDIQLERFEHAKKMLDKYESKLKRQKNLVKKWKRKVYYYEKVFENKKAASKEKI